MGSEELERDAVCTDWGRMLSHLRRWRRVGSGASRFVCRWRVGYLAGAERDVRIFMETDLKLRNYGVTARSSS